MKKAIPKECKIPNLFKLMDERGIKAAELSRMTGISTGNISDWRSGRSAPTTDKLSIVATALNVSTDYLLTGTEQEQYIRVEITEGSNPIYVKKPIVQPSKGLSKRIVVESAESVTPSGKIVVANLDAECARLFSTLPNDEKKKEALSYMQYLVDKVD